MEVLQFSLLGIGAGGLYALAAIGLVLVYRGSGVVNFAQVAIGIVGAYVYYELRVEHDFNSTAGKYFALFAGLLTAGVVGGLFHLLILRRMQQASQLSRIVATLALLITITSISFWRYGGNSRVVPGLMPTGPMKVLGTSVGKDRMIILLLVILITAILWAIYHYTTFGVATSAVAENPRAAASLAVSPDLIAAINWSVGGALGGLAVIMLVPITGLGPGNITFLVIPVLAAAVMGKFSSFPIVTTAGIVLGVTQSLVTRYVEQSGWATAVPFLFVAAYLVASGTTVASKTERFGRMPALGTGRIPPGLVLFGFVLSMFFIWVLFPKNYLQAFEIQILIALVICSFIVITGYAGQISLAQMAMGGLGSLICAFLATRWHWPLELAFLAGVLSTVPVGILLALAGVRTRGVNLAVVTLGFAIALEAVVLGNVKFRGGMTGYRLKNPKVFGIEIGVTRHLERYATLSLIVLALVLLGIANLRRGRAGRRLIAVRTNERAAAALGVSVVGAKVYAFVLSGMIAAVAGILIIFRLPIVQFDQFGAVNSILHVQNAVLGGVGTLAGPLVGSGFAAGGVSQQIFSFLGSDVGIILAVVGGIGLLIMLTFSPDGLAFQMRQQNAWWLDRLRRKLPSRKHVIDLDALGAGTSDLVPPKVLSVRDLTVRFGGVVALFDFSIDVNPGEVVGLIGPNGAGKSTAIEAMTGFVKPSTGVVTFDGADIGKWNTGKRARAGMSRSFQSLELFEDLTVLENVLAACDRRDPLAYLTDLVRPGHGKLTPPAAAALVDFGFKDKLETKVSDLSYAERRMLAVARAVAGGHSVLMLDEPAAGLDDVQTRLLGEAIRRLAAERGVGVLLVEHNVDMVLRTCDRVAALEFGEIIGMGTPDEIRNNERVIDAYLGTSRFREEKAATVD
ncbi:MAG: branched-chain amino acid ABC transporter permease/ATP-binding protein [Actinomycetota bacterium]|nr:branched-chain amino acid ABC transporter permease/ATP-binding protein [Actinomycetota bacterium]